MAIVRDPVCGTMIDSESAQAQVELKGQTFYFCSQSCRKTFEADSARYAGRTASAESTEPQHVEHLEQHEPPYTTLGFLTSPKFGAAGSGGLEYERLPEAHHHDSKSP